MVVCWAATIGGCGSRQSGEHTISANLMVGDTVYVRGFSWCAEREVALPPERFIQNILCVEHNSALSPTDVAGGELFRALGTIREEATRRLRTGKKPKMLRAIHVSGPLVERWMLKTIINVGIGKLGREWTPPDYWVRAAFGLEPLTGTRGMYLLPADWTGVDMTMWELHVELLADNAGRPVGGIVGLDRLRFALCAEDYDAPLGWKHRLACLQDSIRLERFQKLIFDW
jgi:hypothetical protein